MGRNILVSVCSSTLETSQKTSIDECVVKFIAFRQCQVFLFKKIEYFTCTKALRSVVGMGKPRIVKQIIILITK